MNNLQCQLDTVHHNAKFKAKPCFAATKSSIATASEAYKSSKPRMINFNEKIILSDEDHFQVSSSINKQRVTVWYGFWPGNIAGHFFESDL